MLVEYISNNIQENINKLCKYKKDTTWSILALNCQRLNEYSVPRAKTAISQTIGLGTLACPILTLISQVI